jgi:hypothetical protein
MNQKLGTDCTAPWRQVTPENATDAADICKANANQSFNLNRWPSALVLALGCQA